jgi:hypothetical protein
LIWFAFPGVSLLEKLLILFILRLYIYNYIYSRIAKKKKGGPEVTATALKLKPWSKLLTLDDSVANQPPKVVDLKRSVDHGGALCPAHGGIVHTMGVASCRSSTGHQVHQVLPYRKYYMQWAAAQDERLG